MRGPTPLFFFILLVLELTASWLAYRLLLRFQFWQRGRAAGAGYWTLALVSLFIPYSIRLFKLSSEFLHGWYGYLVHAAYAFIIAQFVFVLLGGMYLAGIWFLKRIAGERPPKTGDDGISRRHFLQLTAAAAPLASLSTGIGGVYAAMNEMAVNRFTLTLPGLPPQAEGLKVVQISDLHVGPFFSIAKLESVIRIVRQEQPDMVLLTGDFIDDLELAPAAVSRMSRLAEEIPQGLYFCWGNHEYFRDINRIAALLKKSAIQVIDNSSKPIIAGAQPFYLLGVNYPWADKKEDQQAKRQAFMRETLAGVPERAFRLLITHHPDFIEEAFAAGIPLTLAGHTHGGQVVVGGRTLLPVQYKYMKGMYQQGDYYGYVHAGTGHWLPFRIGCPPEIAVFTLNAKGKSLFIGGDLQ